MSETCVEGSSPECISVNGTNVLLPSEFDQAGVADATVVEDTEQSAVDVTFNEDGAVIFHSLSKEAARAGDEARLVIKIGDEVLTAVMVMQAMESDHVQLGLSPDDNAQEIVDLIQHG
ncbi:hypothetical protein [Paramicrobacterium agarici]|uniref:Uncharacterized protein n=1 Tax=Paramicrobacterium agarici TaxID=630514 RepID=A0A2A9DTN8_9MICO|nr:hypothetical protein [Microbacterium agarici]PFG29515.1 hypothetical protein ATJ78_0422 [Microbacterium agarici]